MADKSDAFAQPLAQAVKRAREKAGLTQKELAEAIGIDSRTILEIENGRGNPKMEVLYPLVRFLKIDARDIFNPERERSNPELRRLRAMVEECNEDEAAVMISVFQTVLHAVRNPNPEYIADSK